jgi:hypothetical protein
MRKTQYTVNPFERKCLKSECECKRCSFNGIEAMCIGCNEGIEHKKLTPVAKCSIIKRGNWSDFCAVVLYDTYMISIPMGICDVPEYFFISKEEYDTFEEWKDVTSKIIEIETRNNKIV